MILDSGRAGRESKGRRFYVFRSVGVTASPTLRNFQARLVAIDLANKRLQAEEKGRMASRNACRMTL
jgi:hypothetical protein